MNKNEIEFVNDGLKKIKNRLECLSLQSKYIYTHDVCNSN